MRLTQSVAMKLYLNGIGDRNICHLPLEPRSRGWVHLFFHPLRPTLGKGGSENQGAGVNQRFPNGSTEQSRSTCERTSDVRSMTSVPECDSSHRANCWFWVARHSCRCHGGREYRSAKTLRIHLILIPLLARNSPL